MTTAPAVLGVGTALPPHYADQEAIVAHLRRLWAAKHHNPARVDQLHRSVRVSGRYLALPPEEYFELDSFAKANAAWGRVGLEIGGEALLRALANAGLAPRDVDHLFFTSVTGLAVPSLDARLVNRLGLRTDVKRSPFFGLGCAGGAGGLARAADYLRAFPGQIAVLLSVELCSLTLQREDLSIPNMISTGLFGDGAAAVVLGGALRRRSPAPRVLASRTILYPNTERVMGWDVVESGFKVVLSAQVPQLVREHLHANVDEFLSDHGFDLGRVRHVVCHTGGPKVLEAVQESLELDSGALARSWASLERLGNLSSASVLFVLGELLASNEAQEGDIGLLVAMGPAFGCELVLLQW